MKTKGLRRDISKLGRQIRPSLPTRVVKPERRRKAARSVMASQETTPQATMLASVSGVVTEKSSGVPLAGVVVKWALTITSGRGSGHGPMELGSAVTDQEGRFSIDATADPKTWRALCNPASGGSKKNGQTYLLLTDHKGHELGRPFPVTPDVREIVLHPAPGGEDKASQRQWKSLATYLTTNRMMLVRELAQQLARPFADSPARDWPVQTRSSALRAMFDALAAEDRQTAEAMDLLYENQFVETASLATGNVRRAVTVFKDIGRLEEFAGVADRIFPWLRQTDRQLYRDYLRGVWVATAQKMYEDLEHVAKPAVALLERQLEERFMQDFHTNDDAPRPAAQLLVPLLVSILTRDAGRGGFGLTPAGIPAQGTKTDDEYLQSLIALSNVKAQELRNRFRVSFERSPGETTSPLQLNVEALLGLLADTYQSPEEPFNALPTVVEGRPLTFGPYIGRAPFFLQYEEWLERQRTFYPENIYDIRKNIPVFDADFRTSMAGQQAFKGAPLFPGQGYFDHYPGERAKSGAWIERMFPITDKLREVLGKMDAQLYADALAKLKDVSDLLWKAANEYDSKWVNDQFWWQWSTGVWNDKLVSGKLYSDIRVSLKDRAKIHVTTPQELASFEKFFDEPYYPVWTGFPDKADEAREKGLAKTRTLYLYNVFYLNLVLIPYLRSQIFFALGDFANAIHALALLTGYRVGVAETTSPPGYDPNGVVFGFPNLYRENTLPYTTLVGFDRDGAYADLPPIFQEPVFQGGMNLSSGRLAIAPFEQRFFKLAQSEVMLAWADQLYRNDDPSSIRRARELYKGVLFLHGEDPEIAPHFPRDGDFRLGLLGIDPFFWKHHENPAKVSQITRARLALYQIEQGLNVYGYREDMVPVLRYKPFKLAADVFAASAKSAQTDFLNYMTRYEQALIELWQTQSLLKKAEASKGIAAEHVAIAQVGVDKAKEQVAAVEAQIVAKQKEIADKDSFFEQAKDFFGGVKDSLTGMVPLAKKVMSDDSAASAVTGEQMLDILGKGVTGGGSAAKDAAAATLGSGAAFMIGFGTFAYTSYSSMEAMAEASAKRAGDLKSLQDVALPAAKAQVRLKERDVAIARFESQIAAADFEFASTLFRFQQDRFLNADFWNKLTLFANRLMRRYVELGARTAWLAERALAFEQNRAVRIVKLNYLPIALRGVTGADRLLADLAELEADRIQGVRLTTPVKHTISLAREFPIQFGQLKMTGRCRFRTREAELRRAYPGTFAYRIRAITVAVQDPDGAPPRGVLRNQGISAVTREDLTRNVLVRFPDALALSEFRLQDDLFVYGLPGETLLQFEGSGFETDWELEFPVEANSRGFRSVADVLITFDTNAYYSGAVAAKQAALAPADAARSIALAASNIDPKGLATLKAATGPVRITFDPARLALPAQEIKRRVTNLALICVGQTPSNYAAKLTATKSAKTASFPIERGLALSNDGPLLGTGGPLPLNDLVGLNLNQPFLLEIERTGVVDELKRLFDIVLCLEYTAAF